MTPEEKIEALREWAASTYYDESSPTWFAGYACARDEVRDIIDPPKPKWRQMVNEEAEKSLIGTPIGAVLYHLSHVANPSEYDAAFELANIIAVAEAQVGDGWQADPARVGPFECGTDDLLDALLSPVSWTTLGCRAAEWLVRLTEDGDARTTPGCPACDGVAGTACRCAEHAPMPESHHHEYVQRWVCECGEQNDPVNVTPERPEHSPVSTADADDGCQCVCEDGTCESCAPRFAWAEYRKDYEPNDTVTAHKAFYAGFEGGLEYAWMREACDPAPVVPEWRRMVDEVADELLDEFKQPPLTTVLSDMAEIASGECDPQDYLARIVAVCEAQVGDGWQADPDDWPDSWDDPVDVWSLLDALCDTEDKWQSIGDRAATWLRSLTDGGAA